jgi:hypothetical protein
MSKRNREKRAAKARERAKARASGEQPRHAPGFGPRAEPSPPRDAGQVADLLLFAARACVGASSDPRPAVRALEGVADDVLARAAEAALLRQVALLWTNGWQPAELHRQGRRGSSASAARLIALAIATDHVSRRSTTLDSRWIAQVEALPLPAVGGGTGWVARWRSEEGLVATGLVGGVLDALVNLCALPRLDELLPPPGSPAASARSVPLASRGVETDPMLARIRALLAKAESTSFEAEAEAFTAKAYELMARHAIDAAVVYAQEGSKDQPVTTRLPVDPPYADAKSLLLQRVAQAGRCRAVSLTGLGMELLMGFAEDVAATEVLFTSLLLQAQHALAEAAKRAPAGTRVRSQAYRSSFLLAYTARIGERLDEINAAVVEAVAAEQGSAFLPVLVSREEAVEGLVEERCGTLRSSRVRGGYDSAGAASGRAAADQAKLNRGDLRRAG